MEVFILIIAFFMMSAASDIGRPEEYRLTITEWRWWLRVGLFALSALLIEGVGIYYGLNATVN
jgi:hypothetical protein